MTVILQFEKPGFESRFGHGTLLGEEVFDGNKRLGMASILKRKFVVY